MSNKKSNINKKSDFSYSYNSFQDRRKDFDGNRVLVADVQDFFYLDDLCLRCRQDHLSISVTCSLL